jgi:hypothetical protein
MTNPSRSLPGLITVLSSMISMLAASVAVRAQDVPVTNYPGGTSVRNLSPAPAPGIHPRIFLSPEDLPALRDAVKSEARQIYYKQLQKLLAEKLDAPATPDGKVMAAIAQGKTPDDAQFAATDDLSYLLALAGIDCTIKNDPARGQLLASALTAWGNYQLTHWVRKPDPVGLHNSFDSNLCLAYDFIAPWMKEEQRAPVRQFIAKMMNGIHIFTWDMPPRWRMWNWAALHVYQGWGSLAIEGEPGFTSQLWDEARTVVRDVGRYNVHPSGALTEDLTYFTLGFEGTGLVMEAMAKRGEQEIWSTSNVSRLKYHLLNQLYPWGGEFQSHADGTGSGFYTSFAIWKFMYPTDPIIDYTWRNRVGEHYDNGGAGNDAAMRVWVVTLFGTPHSAQPVKAADFNQPTTYFCPDRGYLVARTSWDRDALKLDFEAKQDYPIVGHNHADANNFNLDALGRAWVTDTGYHDAAGNQHNQVLIDGVASSPWASPGGKWIDLIDKPQVVIGVSDAAHAYTYHWSDTGYSADNTPPPDNEKWEKETEPSVAAFYAGQENRKRTGIFDHWTPFLLRSLWNPVQRAFRTASLSRGAHPYVFIVDDIQKDDAVHAYDWIAQMPDDVEILRTGGDWVVVGAKNLPEDPKKPNGQGAAKAAPQPDNRRLLVRIIDVSKTDQPNAMAIRLESFISSPGKGYETGPIRKRLVIPARAVNPNFKVLLYPFHEGAELPDVLWNEEHTQCQLIWHDQTDRYTFATAENGRTVYSLDRDGQPLATLQAPPPAPVIQSAERIFIDRCNVALANPGPEQEIRYTLDGSDPTANSTFYAGPFTVEKPATLKAATFARAWRFGDKAVSAITQATFTQQSPLAAISDPPTKPGLHAAIYQGFWNDLPDFSKEQPIATTSVDHFVLPPETPSLGFGAHLNGLVRIPAAGVYTFALHCDDAGKLWIDDQVVVDADHPHVVKTFTGQVALAAGWHKIAVENCDNALPHGKGKGDGSWAFQVLWSPPNAALAELPAELLAQEAASAIQPATVAAIHPTANLVSEPGLDYAAYDRTQQVATPAFFDVASTQPVVTATVSSLVTPDSSEKLLNVYSGYLLVPHAGVYQFMLSKSAIGRITIGDTIVDQVGTSDGAISRAVQLDDGLAPITIAIAKGSGLIQWKGPGMDWQPIQPDAWLRPARPHIVINNADTGARTCELLAPGDVALKLPPTLPQALGDAKIHYTLDGSDPTAQSPAADHVTIDHPCQLKALAFNADKPIGDPTNVSFTISKLPTAGLLGIWSAADLKDNALPNQVKGQAGDLPVPAGLTTQDDPQQGKVIALEQSPKLLLEDPPILQNELTLCFRVKPEGRVGTLVHHGYAHFGFFLEIGAGGGMRGGGGGEWNVVGAPDHSAELDQWHNIALAIGGSPVRTMQVWVDGKLVGSGKTKAPCLTKELEFLDGFTGQLAEIRMYNRVLSADEIAALAKTS